ncbi:NAD(P)/FAD-dependent oxidoreductase [Halopseudomonas salegens]|uniref:L-2-hydroxyglutarate oxidase LhgO n=1 Tax=Halopseudomonas salegens TaxID=1434072 RepID=A0A1H2E407_9GAMM|nr:NAD(P)/FAD-dependent oxidoreductase [Halopseudomonas salegens]SDT89739.1 L-2-hydroxyglutarate oxidase LhgO [Halopseudomonas salegens]
MADVEIVVVGAGAVGLAIAANLAQVGHEVLVLEQEAWVGQHASSRNSEVIHAGLYYPPGSLKAQACRRGRDLLYAWCAEHQVPHRAVGKLLVAVTDGELPALRRLQSNAAANGVHLDYLDADGLHALEPAVRGVAALHSPLTGIVDSHALLQSFEAQLQQGGGAVQLNTRVKRVTRTGQQFQLHGQSVGEAFALSCQWLINSAGLYAQQLAQCIDGLPSSSIPPIHWCQGRYFSYQGRSPFSHLIYPMPEANTAGLGVHATLDLAGQLRFGPDVRYVEQLDYQVDEQLREDFARAIQRYWPDCQPQRLSPAYAGVRAKLSAPGEPVADFQLQDGRELGVPGLINLYGIESPGLTASLALAERVGELVQGAALSQGKY